MNYLEIEYFLKSKELNILTKILRGIPIIKDKTILWDLIDKKTTEYALRHKCGFPLHPLIMHFDETFNMSTQSKVEKLLQKYNNINKWDLYSDYAFYNKDKKHDVVSFVLLPHIYDFPTLSSSLNIIAKKDIKKVKKVDPKLINFFNNSPMISFNFILKKDRFKNNLLLTKKEFIMDFSDFYINYQVLLTIIDFEKYNMYNEQIKKYKGFKEYSKNNNTNRKKLHDLILIGQLAGYLSATIARKHGNIDLFGWFSDKDSFFDINTSKIKNKQPYIIDFYSETAHQIKSKYKSKDLELVVGTSQNIDFLDNILRLPDLLAGTMADWDMDNNILSHNKFIDVVDKIFTNDTQHFFINLEILPKNEFKTSVLDIKLKK